MTLYGRVVDGALDGPIRRPRGSGETKITDGTTVRPGEKGWTDNLLAVCGFVEANIVRPTLSATEVEDGYNDTLEAGVPTRTYRKRPKTAEEIAAEEKAVTVEVERRRIRVMLNDLNTFIDLGTDATAAQVKRATLDMARILRRIIRDQYGEQIDPGSPDDPGDILTTPARGPRP